MDFYNFVLFLSLLSFSKAYTNYGLETKPVINSDYCVLGNTPVCGTNGPENFLLDNECEFNSYNTKQLESGQIALTKTLLANCYPPSSIAGVYDPSSLNPYCPQYCNKIFKPVCATYLNVQRNFTNECELKKFNCQTKTNWQIILNGTCVAASCPLDGQQVCASYNNYPQSFPNLLSLYADIKATGKNWEILNVGPCPCPTAYRPQCAKLNCTVKTFQNECFLEQEIKNGNLWSLLFVGECPVLPTIINTTITPTPTTTTLAPILNANETIIAVNGTVLPLAPVNVTLTDAVLPPVNAVLPPVNAVLPPVNAVLPPVNAVLPPVNAVLPPVNTPAICNLSNLLLGLNAPIINKPVYIIRKNKISPYVPPQYETKVKPASYAPADYINPYKPASSYKPASTYKPASSYKPASTYKPAGTYKPASSYKPASAYEPANIPVASPYSGSYKLPIVKTPVVHAAASGPSNYQSDYYSKPPSKTIYKTQPASDYNPVSISSHCKVPQINYSGEYDTADLHDSPYDEAFT